MLLLAGEREAVVYLSREHFTDVPLGAIQQLYKGVASSAYGSEHVLLGGHWIGIFGTYPGTGT
eukprot:3250477-Lingulodinium_polyedra.AAC.1